MKQDLNEIDCEIYEGRLLMAALAVITTECRTNKTPYEVIDELDKLSITRETIGGFVNYYYWSSSEFNLHYAWFQSFLVGNQYADTKNVTFYVRPVRAFG